MQLFDTANSFSMAPCTRHRCSACWDKLIQICTGRRLGAWEHRPHLVTVFVMHSSCILAPVLHKDLQDCLNFLVHYTRYLLCCPGKPCSRWLTHLSSHCHFAESFGGTKHPLSEPTATLSVTRPALRLPRSKELTRELATHYGSRTMVT